MNKLIIRLPSPYQISLTVLAISIITVIQFAIIYKACLASDVTCVVKDNNTKERLPQAVVKIKNDLTGETTVGTTGNDGKVVFAGVGVGDYHVIANAQCYKRKVKTLTISGEIDFKLRFKLNPLETEQGTLSGIVKDGITALGIEGASVAIWPNGPTVQTAEDGSYLFDCIEVGSYKVSAFKEGYLETKRNVQIEDPPAVTTKDFTLHQTKVTGIVTDAVSEDPIKGTQVEAVAVGAIIPDISVEASTDSTLTKTDKEGKYKLSPPPGTYELWASKYGYDKYVSETPFTLESGVAQRNGSTHTEDIVLDPCDATLKVKVKDKNTGDPIPDATGRIIDPESEGAETTTNSKGVGKFDQQCLTPGTSYTVEAEKGGYDAIEKMFTAAEGENKLTFNLEVVTTTTTTTTTDGTTTTTDGTTTTTVSTTTTTESTTTTTTGGTTTTILCVGEEENITTTNTCTTVGFDIVGESGPRTEELIYERDGKNRIVKITGKVTYTNTGNAYCVEINVIWGFFCISDVNGKAAFIEPPPNIEGVWLGEIASGGANPYSIEMCISQEDDQVSGNWTSTPGGICGSLSGSVSDTDVTLSLVEGCECPGTFSASASLSNSDNTITGSFTGSDCAGSGTSDFTMDREATTCVSGKWTGPYTISGSLGDVEGEMSLCLIQYGTEVVGSWITYTGNPATTFDSCGNVSGDVSGSVLTFTLLEDCSCSGTFSGSATFSNSDTTLTGSFSGSDCLGDGNGTLTLDKTSKVCD